jgi:hypothetical protein
VLYKDGGGSIVTGVSTIGLIGGSISVCGGGKPMGVSFSEVGASIEDGVGGNDPSMCDIGNGVSRCGGGIFMDGPIGGIGESINGGIGGAKPSMFTGTVEGGPTCGGGISIGNPINGFMPFIFSSIGGGGLIFDFCISADDPVGRGTVFSDGAISGVRGDCDSICCGVTSVGAFADGGDAIIGGGSSLSCTEGISDD